MPQSLLDDANDKFGHPEVETTDNVLRWNGKCLYVEHKIHRDGEYIRVKMIDVTADVAACLTKKRPK